MITYERFVIVLSSIVHRIYLWMQKQEVLYLRSKMKVGINVDIKKGFKATKPDNITIGDNVSIGLDVIMQAHGPIAIGDYTLIAAGVNISTAKHFLNKRKLEMRGGTQHPVTIGKSCWLGSGVIVLPGVTIGDGTVVGAGSVVSKDLPPEMICMGVPAKPVKPRPKA